MAKPKAPAGSVGQFKELSTQFLRAIPTDLPAEVVQAHIANRPRSDRIVQLLLSQDPTDVDIDQLEQQLVPPDVVRKLRKEGWFVIRCEVPLPLDFACIARGLHIYGTVERRPWTRCESLPTVAGTWYAFNPLINWSTRGGSFADVYASESVLTGELQGIHGPTVRVALPSLEEAHFLLSAHLRQKGEIGLTFRGFWCRNHYGPEEDNTRLVGFLYSSKSGRFAGATPCPEEKSDFAGAKMFIAVVTPE